MTSHHCLALHNVSGMERLQKCVLINGRALGIMSTQHLTMKKITTASNVNFTSQTKVDFQFAAKCHILEYFKW
jgi:hypothetical protein